MRTAGGLPEALESMPMASDIPDDRDGEPALFEPSAAFVVNGSWRGVAAAGDTSAGAPSMPDQTARSSFATCSCVRTTWRPSCANATFPDGFLRAAAASWISKAEAESDNEAEV